MEVSKINLGVVTNKAQANKLKNTPYFTSVKESYDKFEKKDPSCDNKFTKLEALKNFGKGIISPLKAIVQHPFISIGMIGATIAACMAVPALGPLMTIGFGALSLYEVGKGTYNAVKEYKNGNYDNSERAFEKIGTGVVGTVLTALGLKNSANCTLELVEAQKAGRPLSALEKLKIADKVKNNGLYPALKDTLKIFSKDGLKAFGNSLKPSNIISRFTRLRNVIKTMSKVSPEEINRRSNMTTRDIRQEAQAIFDKTFDEMGVPRELRPKLEISDELRYQTVEDANKIISDYVTTELSYKNYMNPNPEPFSAEFFAPTENLKSMTNEEILARIKSVLNQDPKTASLTSDKVGIDTLLNIQNPKNGGAYSPTSHSIVVNTGGYRKGNFASLEDIVCHEALHAKMAILRASLSKEEAQLVIKELLRGRILNGEPEQILQEGGFLGNIMMDAPKMTPKMRQDFLRYADEFIFAGGDSSEASVKLAQLLDTNPEFIVQNGGTREAALEVLQNYVTSHKTRFKFFSDVEIRNLEPMNLSPEQHQIALESLKDSVATAEGNSRNGGIFVSMFGTDKKAFIQYQFSPEELLARNTAAEMEKAKISAILEDTTLSLTKRAEYMQRMQDLDFILEYNAVGKEYYELYTKVLNNPDDAGLIKALKELDARFNEFEKIKISGNVALETKSAFPTNMYPYLPHNKQS